MEEPKETIANIRFFTRTSSIIAPDTINAIPLDSNRDRLTEVLHAITGLARRLLSTTVPQKSESDRDFDFFVGGELLRPRVSLKRFLARKGISAEVCGPFSDRPGCYTLFVRLSYKLNMKMPSAPSCRLTTNAPTATLSQVSLCAGGSGQQASREGEGGVGGDSWLSIRPDCLRGMAGGRAVGLHCCSFVTGAFDGTLHLWTRTGTLLGSTQVCRAAKSTCSFVHASCTYGSQARAGRRTQGE